jgi:hypothetical protein
MISLFNKREGTAITYNTQPNMEYLYVKTVKYSILGHGLHVMAVPSALTKRDTMLDR